MTPPRRVREYEGLAIRVLFEPRRCIHAEECVHGLPAVFDRSRRPWVDPTAAPAEAIADVVRRCPTGALRYERLDGGEPEAPPARNSVRVSPDGPLYLRGDVEVVDDEGRVAAREIRVALCRCGASRHKPYCDGRHAEVGFRDPGTLAAPRGRAPETVEGALRVHPLPGGPLRLEGPFELAGPDGETRELGLVSLCRCGGSSAKPFCDGTHKEIGVPSS